MSTSATTMYEWDTIPWPRLERSVSKLQKRIYQAAREGNWLWFMTTASTFREVCNDNAPLN